jgi:hypothetical protein
MPELQVCFRSRHQHFLGMLPLLHMASFFSVASEKKRLAEQNARHIKKGQPGALIPAERIIQMKKGEWIETPRFCKVKIKKVFRSNERANKEGYTEPTHYRNNEYYIRGKSIGNNRMIFAAIKRD